MRKINLKLLLAQGVLYRLVVILVYMLFMWVYTGKFVKSIELSIIWGLINFGIYYIYHYLFLKRFKVGVEK